MDEYNAFNGSNFSLSVSKLSSDVSLSSSAIDKSQVYSSHMHLCTKHALIHTIIMNSMMIIRCDQRHVRKVQSHSRHLAESKSSRERKAIEKSGKSSKRSQLQTLYNSRSTSGQHFICTFIMCCGLIVRIFTIYFLRLILILRIVFALYIKLLNYCRLEMSQHANSEKISHEERRARPRGALDRKRLIAVR